MYSLENKRCKVPCRQASTILGAWSVPSRRKRVTPVAANPDSAWVVQQTHNCAAIEDAPVIAMLYLDRNTKFTKRIRDSLEDSGFKPVLCPIQAPNMSSNVGFMVYSGNASTRS